MNNSVRAIVLMSGGLDSMLAARVVQDHGVEVIGVHFATGFCTVQRKRRVARPEEHGTARLRNEALHSAAELEIPIDIIDVSQPYLRVVLNPRHGYGAHMNPCQDCRAFMLERASEQMKTVGAHFVVTGEVVGQRPNSQKRHLLYQTEKESGLQGLLLRPLSAKLLRPTIPEERGWVDRERLYDFSGRGRKQQLLLAEQFGITDFAQPAGGCCQLVEAAYSRRLRDFLAHNPSEAFTQEEAALLSVGRHLRLSDGSKLIIGRHEGENAYLDRARHERHWRIEAAGGGSPVALAYGPLSPESARFAAAVVAGYSTRSGIRAGPSPG